MLGLKLKIKVIYGKIMANNNLFSFERNNTTVKSLDLKSHGYDKIVTALKHF